MCHIKIKLQADPHFGGTGCDKLGSTTQVYKSHYFGLVSSYQLDAHLILIRRSRDPHLPILDASCSFSPPPWSLLPSPVKVTYLNSVSKTRHTLKGVGEEEGFRNSGPPSSSLEKEGGKNFRGQSHPLPTKAKARLCAGKFRDLTLKSFHIIIFFIFPEGSGR